MSKHNRYTREQRAAAVEAYKAGASTLEVAARIGASPDSVRMWLTRAGVPRRSKNTPRLAIDWSAEFARDVVDGRSTVTDHVRAARTGASTATVGDQRALAGIKAVAYSRRATRRTRTLALAVAARREADLEAQRAAYRAGQAKLAALRAAAAEVSQRVEQIHERPPADAALREPAPGGAA